MAGIKQENKMIYIYFLRFIIFLLVGPKTEQPLNSKSNCPFRNEIGSKKKLAMRT